MSAREEVVQRLNWLVEGVHEDIKEELQHAGVKDDWTEGYLSGYKNAMHQALAIIASEFGEES